MSQSCTDTPAMTRTTATWNDGAGALSPTGARIGIRKYQPVYVEGIYNAFSTSRFTPSAKRPDRRRSRSCSLETELPSLPVVLADATSHAERLYDFGGAEEARGVRASTRNEALRRIGRLCRYDRAVTSLSQVRTVLETCRARLFTEIFPGRSVVPKTLIFCKDDAHAEQVVTTAREAFGKGNDFAAKITYTATDAKRQLQAFRTSSTLRIAVTVDMIATGTDVKPLECVMFMKDVRSAPYFEQMKGRGARTIAPADFQAMTPDASDKTRFVIADAVGVTEHDFVEPPLNRERGVSLKQLPDRRRRPARSSPVARAMDAPSGRLRMESRSAPGRTVGWTDTFAAGSAVREMPSYFARCQDV